MNNDSRTTRLAHRATPRRWLPYAIVVAIVLGIAATAYFLSKAVVEPPRGGRFGGGRGGFGMTSMPVGTATVAAGDIHVYLNALGTATSLRSVAVTAQVAGQLKSVQFKEGQHVQRGDLLAEIDPRTFEAALSQAQGALAKDQALLAEAKIDLDRYQTLFKQDSIAKQQVDSQASLVRQYEAQVASDQGQIATAKVNLGYTKILAPVTGRVGLRQIDPGNNVSVGTNIVVVTQLKPIDVLFAVPEDNLPIVLKGVRAGASMAVQAYDRSGANKLAEGGLASLDNQVDTSTGTVKAKAEFSNDDESLFPNQFVNVRLLLDTLRGAAVIPTSALQRGADGMFVYVVQADKTAVARSIQTGPSEGERVAVTQGLTIGEVVVTSGGDRLREGSKVEVPGDNPQPAGAASGAQTADASDPHGQPGQGTHRRSTGVASPAGASTNKAKPTDEKKQ